MKHLILFIAVTTLAAGSAIAQPRRGRPPQEAFDACNNQSVGETCTVATPHGELSGTCQIPPNTEILVCVPEGHRPPPRGEAPQGG